MIDEVHLSVEACVELVRLARLFVVDRNAAEDLVQEAFIRLSRSLDRVQDESRLVAYLRSIVLNLARDHNRRGLVSLRHQPPALALKSRRRPSGPPRNSRAGPVPHRHSSPPS